MLGVAAEELVRTLSRERHRHVLRRHLGQGMEAQCREIGHRLVQVPDEFLELDGVVDVGELELVVVRPEELRDVPSVCELVVVTRFGEADRERLHRLRHVSRHQRHDQAGVEASRQHRAERDVAHQAKANGLVEQLEQPFRPLVDGGTAVDLRLRIGPVLLHLDLAGLDHEPLTRQQLGDHRQRGLRRREEAEGEVHVDRLVVELGADEAAGEQGLELGCEEEQVAAARVVERLDAEAVAGDDGAPPGSSQTAIANLPRSLSANAVPAYS